MLRRVIALFTFLLLAPLSKGEIISLSGIYEGINLYVETDSVQKGACILDIFVNDEKITFEREQLFFEIDMSFLKLKEHVSVKIICSSGCKVKVLNPEAINLMYGFQFMNLTVEQDKIKWNTTNEKPGGKYIIEMKVDKQWVPVGELVGKPGKLLSFYEKKVDVLKHYYYRVKYMDKDGIIHSSKPVKFHK